MWSLHNHRATIHLRSSLSLFSQSSLKVVTVETGSILLHPQHHIPSASNDTQTSVPLELPADNNSSHQTSTPKKIMSRFKTELCNNLIELGSCKYGDRCHYAHGAHELRQVSRRHPKYRTEKCKNFELTGKCPFGPRCSYVHPRPDLDSMIDQLSKYMKHTRAPKPEPEEESDTINNFHATDDNFSLPFTRTNTNTSLSMSSTCDSITTSNDENKENHLIVNYQALINKQLVSSSSSSSPTALPTTSASKNLLSINTSSNILTSFNPSSAKHYNNQKLSNDSKQTFQFNDDPMIDDTASNKSNAGAFSNNCLIELPSHESNKKLRRISITSTNSNSANNPFGIISPFNEFLNTTNLKSRSPLQPNKQFYTRF